MADSLLWQIEHPRTSVKHHVYGTMHVKNQSAFTFLEKIEELVRAADIYVGEMDLGDPILAELPAHFIIGGHQTLKTLYGQRKYTKLQRVILKAYGVDIDDFIDLKPMIVANMIAEKLLTEQYSVSLDSHLWTYADSKGKHMLGLESGERQISIMKSISIDVQKKMLNQTAKNVSRYRKKIIKISDLYAAGQMKKLYKATKRSLGELRKPLLYDRNYYMADRILEITETDDRVFITFGAAHLGGKFGVLRLLKKSGYRIKPIKILP